MRIRQMTPCIWGFCFGLSFPCSCHTLSPSSLVVSLFPPLCCAPAVPVRAQVRSQYRKIFTNMGFTEMPTNNYVESSFWNFDSLFQPQQHPARDAHDTFFLTSPATSDTFPEDYLQRVKVSRGH